jgi:UDP-N-acetylglucosamine 2-epimerase (non-hydrolysing)
MSVVGARPNFMKIAPFIRAVARRNASDPGGIEHRLVHTGQHYEAAMSDAFFRALSIPEPDIHLSIGSGTHAEQVGRTMIAFESALRGGPRPDWVVVVGDVNATCACSITAKKERLRLAHIEAGLRSFDLEMPEEINRMVTDRLSDLLFTTDEGADRNLLNEGTPAAHIRLAGNIMIDTLDSQLPQARALDPHAVIREHAVGGNAGLPREAGRFAVLTLHRPSNVDGASTLTALAEVLSVHVAAAMPLVWVLHPRTEQNLKKFGLMEKLSRSPGVVVCRAVGYTEMLALNMAARVMLTDSGGLQEESCVLGTPCLTLRWNTERPVTLLERGGVCVLAGNDPARIAREFDAAARRERKPFRPPLWDGRTAGRIVEALAVEGADEHPA